ncbi:MAG: hypothetical protein KGM91_15215, partial [Burkholderiales bacterium]|nr:hypothetical protein [Burkholderiales bacterium]
MSADAAAQGADPLARVEDLRGSAAADPAGWAVIEGLARRAAGLEGEGRRALMLRLDRRLDQWLAQAAVAPEGLQLRLAQGVAQGVDPGEAQRVAQREAQLEAQRVAHPVDKCVDKPVDKCVEEHLGRQLASRREEPSIKPAPRAATEPGTRAAALAGLSALVDRLGRPPAPAPTRAPAPGNAL